MKPTMPQHRRLASWIAALSAIVCAVALLAGCGGGNSGSPAGIGGVTPNNYAPLAISGRTFTFTDPDQPQFTTVYVFSVTTYTSPSGDSGTYTYSQTSGVLNQGVVHIVSSFSPALTDTMTFTSYSAGTYVDTVGKTSTFTMQ
jgi:hypothetical protein